MSSTGQHILSEQNTEQSINCLAAQREIYSTGKTLFYFQIIIAIPIPILLSIVKPLLGKTGDNYAWVFALYGIIAAVGEVLLENRVSSLKKMAASIQEEFDCKVLGIPWNSTLIPTKPDTETIFHYSKQYKAEKDVTKLHDWYSLAVGYIETNIASVICQRTNCSYDFGIRKKYFTAVIVTAIITFILIFIISCCSAMTLQSFIVTVLLPSVPVFVLAIKQGIMNRDSIENLKSLMTQIEAILLNSKIDTQIDNTILRQIQDKIYSNRILSPLLPDKLYDALRKGLEEEMDFSAEAKVKQLEQQNDSLP